MPVRDASTGTCRSGDCGTAIVTGGSRGIGLACVRALAESGFSVFFTARDQERIEAATAEVSEIVSVPPRGFRLDSADPVATYRLVEEVVAERGDIDLVVANAGAYLGKTIEATRCEEWEEVVRVNLNGPFYLFRAALPHLRRSAGIAIAIGSVSGTKGYGDEAAYGASKRALRLLTESITAEAATDGVRATLISPGVVKTRMAASIFGSDHDEGRTAPGTLAADDIAATIKYLLHLSPAAVVNEIVLNDTRWAHT